MKFRYHLVGFGYHLLYNQLAWTYDAVAWLASKGEWRRWGQTVLQFALGPRILEVGFGPGHLLAHMAGRGYRPAGLDLSAAMVGQARRNLDRYGLDVPLIRGLAQTLPFGDGVFDSVVMTFPAAFAIGAATRREVWRVLRPGGRWVIADSAQLAGAGPWARLVNLAFRLTSTYLPPEALEKLFSGEPEVDAPAGEIDREPRFRLSWSEARTTYGVVRVVVAEREPAPE